jgi:drug/metabolite transporter (DMT)-like permease
VLRERLRLSQVAGFGLACGGLPLIVDTVGGGGLTYFGLFLTLGGALC